MFTAFGPFGVYKTSLTPESVNELCDNTDTWIPQIQHCVCKWNSIVEELTQELNERENSEKMISYLQKTSRRFQKADEAVKKYCESLQESARLSVEKIHQLSSDRAHDDRDINGSEWDVITPVDSKRKNIETYANTTSKSLEKTSQLLESLQKAITDIMELPNCVKKDLDEWKVQLDKPSWTQWIYGFSKTPKFRNKVYSAGASAGVYLATSGASVTDLYSYSSMLLHPLTVLTEYGTWYLGGFGLGFAVMMGVCGLADMYMKCKDRLEDIYSDLEMVRDCIRKDISIIGDWCVDSLQIVNRVNDLELFECDTVISQISKLNEPFKKLEKSAFIAVLPVDENAEWASVMV